MAASASSTVKTTSAGKLLASSTAVVLTEPDSISDVQEVSTRKNILACPICYYPLIWNGDPVLSVDSAPRSSFQCGTCKKSYFGNETHLDLTVASGAKEYGEAMPASTYIFRTPLVSFLYERGWRQSFSVWGGFPGPEGENNQMLYLRYNQKIIQSYTTNAVVLWRDNKGSTTLKQFELMKEYLKPVLGGNIVDASCGSGLFSRRLAKSGLFSLVVALDFSENMLRQCYKFIKQEENFPKENFILVRADISRLPFPSRSVDAVHAGAAIHCWPSPSTAVAEISRVLRPGGVFVATTFILNGPYSGLPLLRPLWQNIWQISGGHIFLDEHELQDLCDACGLVGFTCTRNKLFVMISATKPS